MLTRRESILMFACVEEDRVPQMMFRLNSFTGLLSCVHPHQLSWHPCFSSSSCAPATSAVLNSCATVSCRKVSLFSLVICVPSRAIMSNSSVSAALRRVQCAKHCANDFVDFGVLHCVHQCVWVRAAWLCDSAAVSFSPKVVTDVAFSSIS